MKYLPEDPHTFALPLVLDKHKSRLIEPAQALDSAGDETASSTVARFKCYDDYERCDLSLSRLTIEVLVHPGLRSEVIVQFNHTPLFKKFPGSVYLMMVLEVCHASCTFKIDEASKSLDALSLADFPGESISKFLNETQRLIKILKGGYALPYQLGSQIQNKDCSTRSLYFNRSVFNLLDKAMALEKAHGLYRDPKQLESKPGYDKYGPLGLCITMRENYSNLMTTNQ